MVEPKITDEELEEEVQEGKTQKQIASEYGYSYPSAHLSEKIRELGYSRNNKLSRLSSGGAVFSVTSDMLSEALERKGIDPGQNQLYFSAELTEDGNIVVRPTSDEWDERPSNGETR